MSEDHDFSIDSSDGREIDKILIYGAKQEWSIQDQWIGNFFLNS